MILLQPLYETFSFQKNLGRETKTCLKLWIVCLTPSFSSNYCLLFYFCKGSFRCLIFLFYEPFVSIDLLIIAQKHVWRHPVSRVSYQNASILLPSKRWSGRQKLKKRDSYARRHITKSATLASFPFFLFFSFFSSFSFLFISISRLKKTTTWLTNFISKTDSMKF